MLTFTLSFNFCLVSPENELGKYTTAFCDQWSHYTWIFNSRALTSCMYRFAAAPTYLLTCTCMVSDISAVVGCFYYVCLFQKCCTQF